MKESLEKLLDTYTVEITNHLTFIQKDINEDIEEDILDTIEDKAKKISDLKDQLLKSILDKIEGSHEQQKINPISISG